MISEFVGCLHFAHKSYKSFYIKIHWDLLELIET